MNLKPDPNFIDAGDLIPLSNPSKLQTLVFPSNMVPLLLEYSTYRVINRTDVCECPLLANSITWHKLFSCKDNAVTVEGFSPHYVFKNSFQLFESILQELT